VTFADHEFELLRESFSGRLLVDDVETAPFLTDWRGKWTGRAIAVAQPDSAEDVATIVRWCADRRVPIVPQGGNTGLSGGCTPDDSGTALVVSTSRMRKIRSVDPASNTILVEAGATLQAVQDTAQQVERLFPLSLAAEGSCTIGGNLATNAGGVHVLRYGNARDLCLGIEVVTPEGEIWDGLRALRKDNSGYDLRDLYVGAEGTLGIITACVLKLFPLPAARVVAFAAVPSPSAAVELLQLAQARLGTTISAFELINEASLALVEKHVPGRRRPLDETSPWYVLLEISDNRSEDNANAGAEELLMSAMNNGLVTDATLSTSLAQFRSLWDWRENISESQGAEGPTIKHDISLPISRIVEFLDDMETAVESKFPGLRKVIFGHLGDGNLHYNFSPAAGDRDDASFVGLEASLNECVHDAVVSLDGSISAEHGLGVLRRDEAARYKPSVELNIMRAVKTALDPYSLMNPGKVLL
jgi:FAD/FMN-containing dehydrogenase